MDSVMIAGVAKRVYLNEIPPKIDEVAFECCSAALADAGMRIHHIGMSVICSMDLYDARTISNGLVSPAVGGYLNEEIRLEGDAATGVIAAAAAIRARKTEAAVVVAVHSPETDANTTRERRQFLDQISSYTFEPHFARPVGLSTTAVLGLQAARAIDTGRVTRTDLADWASDEINRGTTDSWGGRDAMTSAEDVLRSPPVADPLTELMMPAAAVGVVAMVLTSEIFGRRVRGRRGWLRSWSSSTNHYTWDPAWLTDPANSASVAAKRAYERGDIHDVGEEIDTVECNLLSPALRPYVLDALGVPEGYPDDRINRLGGVRSSFPGVATGGLQLLTALDTLASLNGSGSRRAVVHGMESTTGTVSTTSSVLVVEAS